MAKKVFIFNLSFSTGNIPIETFATCDFICLDGSILIYPVGGIYAGEAPTATTPITSSDTLNSIRARLSSFIPAAYGESIPFIWMDDKGLL